MARPAGVLDTQDLAARTRQVGGHGSAFRRPAGRYTNTDSVSPGRAANRLGRFGIAATEDELDAAFHPEGVDGHRDADHSPADAQWPVSGARPAPT